MWAYKIGIGVLALLAFIALALVFGFIWQGDYQNALWSGLGAYFGAAAVMFLYEDLKKEIEKRKKQNKSKKK